MSVFFLEFMDCVWQLWDQFPRCFEFNESLLLFILESLYSCRFGTFLQTKEKQRRNEKAMTSTVYYPLLPLLA